MVRASVMLNENAKTPHKIKLCIGAAKPLVEDKMSPVRVAGCKLRTSRKYRRRKRISQNNTSSNNNTIDSFTITEVPLENTLQEYCEQTKTDLDLVQTQCGHSSSPQNTHRMELNGHHPVQENKQEIIENGNKQKVAPKTRFRALKNANTNIQKAKKTQQSNKLTEYYNLETCTNTSASKLCPNKSPTKPNRKLTEFYPVRRSVRKTSKCVQAERTRDIEMAIREGREDGLEVCVFDMKGRGVIACRDFRRGDFVVEYSGMLLDSSEAKKREEMYARDPQAGCYMYYFKCNNQQYCIDATAESGKLGRLVNHSRNGNLQTKIVFVDGLPHLVLIAAQDISRGEELTYDYGDRSKESLIHHPWLAF